MKFIGLVYHELTDNPTNKFDLSVSTFQAHLDYLKGEGYTVDSAAGLEQRLATQQLPERYALLTFDDGYKSNMLAAEMVRKAGFQASFFITKIFCLTDVDHLDEPEIRELGNMCSVGGHTVTHRPLSKLPEDEIRSEFVECKTWLEDITGKEATTCSAPFGYLNDTVIRIVQETGHSLIGNSSDWWNTLRDVEHSRTINRVTIQPSHDVSRFDSIMTRNLAFYSIRRARLAARFVKRLLPLDMMSDDSDDDS